MQITTSSPANPLGSSATSAPTALTSSALLPLVYWFGNLEMKKNPLLMDKMIQNLARDINERLDSDPISTSLVFNQLQTMTLFVSNSENVWHVHRHSSKFQHHCGENGRRHRPEASDKNMRGCFERYAPQTYHLTRLHSAPVNVIVVVGHEKLYVETQRMFGGESGGISVVKIPKSGGVS